MRHRRHRLPTFSILVSLLAGGLFCSPRVNAEPTNAELLERVRELENRLDASASQKRIEALERRLMELESEKRLQGDLERFDALTERLDDLEIAMSDSPSAFPSWVNNLRLSGSANVGYFEGDANSWFPEGAFQVWDARFFIEGELGRDINFGENRVIRDIGFVFEWDLVRLGEVDNRVGDLYVDFHGLLDTDWANLQFGRFQIPLELA